MFGPGTLDPNMRRRSVYFFIKRSQLIPSMMLFDWPEHLVSIGQRASTTTAPQALLFMNSPLGRASAEGLASRVAASRARRARSGARYKLCLRPRAERRGMRLALDFLPTSIRPTPRDNKPDPARPRIRRLLPGIVEHERNHLY